MAKPGRGYGVLPQEQIERDMPADRKRENRAQALLELARQPLTPELKVDPLPDDWEQTTPSEIVDDLKRAAQRHGVPLPTLARLTYQEGKFNDPRKLPGGKPLVMSSDNPDIPVGWVQMTKRKFDTMRNLAAGRGDTARARELASYSLANREQAFDVAAELLAYQERLLGSWHASVAAYNVGDNFMDDWLAGRDRSEPYDRTHRQPGRPPDLIRYDRDPVKLPNKKWTDEMANYLRIIFRGAPDEPQYKVYDHGNLEQTFRVPSPIPRSAATAFGRRVSQDARENP